MGQAVFDAGANPQVDWPTGQSRPFFCGPFAQRANVMKTYSPRPRDIDRRWYVLDAQDAVLGRVASEAAKLLRGKHKPIYAPHMDTGDHVIVINARGVVVTGGKEEKKIVYHHSGYPGGIKAVAIGRLLAERPATVVEKAIRGMLPKNRIGRQMYRKLAVYEGPEHPHQAQKPVALGLGEVPAWEGIPEPKPVPKPKRKPERPKTGAKSARPAGASRTGGRAGPGSSRRAEAKSSTGSSPERKGRSRRPAAAAEETQGESSPAEGRTRSGRRSKDAKES